METGTALARRYRRIRRETEALCQPLQAEDMAVQPYEWVSPPKWHLAHTTWFFEAFILERFQPGYRAFDPRFAFLFNSYYESMGPRAEKSRRGSYSRPTVEEVRRYRRLVDLAMEDFLDRDPPPSPEAAFLAELGLQHEQQHQELLLMDIKAILHANPGRPAYLDNEVAKVDKGRPDWAAAGPSPAGGYGWIPVPGGLKSIGWAGTGFAYDNEAPRHRVWLEPFRIADRPVDQGSWLEFMEAGGYARPELWLSDGWRMAREQGWEAPLYWEREGGAPDGRWLVYGWHGLAPVDPAAPVAHLSYYEADAFARWSGARLPTEAEWEAAVAGPEPGGPEDVRVPGREDGGFPDRLAAGRVWEWTSSAYLPYPGFRPFAGGLGEYNAKFMAGQMVLRGGCEATPEGHLRVTYRNYYPPGCRWQFGGVRLAREP